MDAAIWVRAGIAATGRAAGRIFRRGRESTRTAVPPIWLIGDPTETARLRALLIQSRKCILAVSSESAAELLFCQGDGFGFHDCIAALAAAAPYQHGQRAKFHAAGSNSASGSSNRDGRGETLLF